MALGVLAIFFYVIIALVVLGSLGIFVIKNPLLQKILILFMVILSIAIGIINFTSLPSNFILKKIIAVLISLIPVGGLVLAYYKKINPLILKIIIILGNILGSLFLMI